MNNEPHREKSRVSRRRTLVTAALLGLACAGGAALAAEGDAGKALLESNCGRCHGVAAGAASPLAGAPNLFVVLGSYPGERLDAELSEGIGSRHRDMPQIQFTAEEIASIYYYLHGEEPESELRQPR
jgi:mono/diheme cytochrome c family protein